MYVGLIVILVGALYLFKALGYILPVDWSVLWPTITILVGIAMVTRSNRYQYYKHWGNGYGHVCSGEDCENGKCNCDCEGCGDHGNARQG